MTTLSKRPSAARSAALLIYAEGPKTREELYAAVDFGNQPSKRGGVLRDAVNGGWLEVREDGKYDVTFQALAMLEQENTEKPVKFVGEKAAPRSINLMNRPAYVPPPKRIPRDDEPAWAKRGKTT